MTTHATLPAVLIADDDLGLRLALHSAFVARGWHSESASGLEGARKLLRQRRFDLVISDVRMADGNGFELMRTVHQQAGSPAFLLFTAFASVPEAVEAVQTGAADYLAKPVSFDLLWRKANALVRQRPSSLERTQVAGFAPEMIGQSPALQRALARAHAAAESDADVLLEAESGTGKELLARQIHDQSRRREKPFIAINCAALPEALLESELFGHARGAFTGAVSAKIGKFELAHGGTLLLDEIGEMPLSLQPKLLRVLQERTVERLGESRPIRTDIRVIASTNLHLRDRVHRGYFRGDLYYRLNVIPLTLPPLRERREDIPVLANHFAQHFALRQGVQRPRLQPCFLQKLTEYGWPGNVRELSNFVQRVLSFTSSPEITATDFDREHRPVHTMHILAKEHTFTAAERPHSLDEMERKHLEHTLQLVDGNRTRAAEMLGISVRTMRNKIRQYDLPPRRYA